MQTKLSQVKKHFEAGNLQEAIRLCARFADLGEQRAAILDAHTAYSNPRFLAQIGKDPEAMKEAGRKAILARYY